MVNIQQISNGSVLVYNSTLDKWVPGAGGGAGIVYTARPSTLKPVTDENVMWVTCLHLAF
jgi:hypothetical protein